MTKLHTLLAVVLTALALSSSPAAVAQEYTPTEWKELIPEGFKPPPVRSQAYYDENPEEAKQSEIDAPLVESLDGKKIRIPGYVVQLEGDADNVTEFLLVPYFGACIHVPPPPPNQIILVRFPKGVPYEITYDAVWVEGTVEVERVDGELAVVGYQIEAANVESYY